MPDTTNAVIRGIDCHTDFHVAAALDPLGQLLDARSFPANSAGYRATHESLGSFSRIIAVGVESTGSFGAGLSRSLTAAGYRVVEIKQPHPHTRARRGKNDAIDAEAAARKALSGEATGAAKDTTGSLRRSASSAPLATAPPRPEPLRSARWAICSSPPPQRYVINSHST